MCWAADVDIQREPGLCAAEVFTRSRAGSFGDDWQSTMPTAAWSQGCSMIGPPTVYRRGLVATQAWVGGQSPCCIVMRGILFSFIIPLIFSVVLVLELLILTAAAVLPQTRLIFLAAMSSSSRTRHPASITTSPVLKIDDCLINDGDDTLHLQPLPITLRILSDPSKHTALFRLRVTVALADDAASNDADTSDSETNMKPAVNGQGKQKSPSLTPFFLDIRPDDISALTFNDNILHFRLQRAHSITLIAPRVLQILRHRMTPVLTNFSLLTTVSALRIKLPAAASTFEHLQQRLVALATIINSGHVMLQPDPLHQNMRSMYQGQGGRVVDVPREVLHWLSLPTSAPPPSLDATFVSTGAKSLLHDPSPPAYQSTPVNSNRLPRPGLRTSYSPLHKRPRTRSSSDTSSSTDVAGRRNKMMRELLQRGEEQTKQLRDLLQELQQTTATMDRKRADMAREADRLTGLIQMANRVQIRSATMEHMGGADITNLDAPRIVNDTSHASVVTDPTPTTPSQSEISTAAASNWTREITSSPPPLSSRLEQEMRSQVACLRAEINAQEYATKRDLDNELQELTVRYDDDVWSVVKNQVEEAMEEALDGIVERAAQLVRDKLREALTE